MPELPVRLARLVYGDMLGSRSLKISIFRLSFHILWPEDKEQIDRELLPVVSKCTDIDSRTMLWDFGHSPNNILGFWEFGGGWGTRTMLCRTEDTS